MVKHLFFATLLLTSFGVAQAHDEAHDETEAGTIVDEMLDVFYNDPPWLMLYFQPNYYGVSNRITWQPRRDARISVLDAALD